MESLSAEDSDSGADVIVTGMPRWIIHQGGAFPFDVTKQDDNFELIMTDNGGLVDTHPDGDFEVMDAAMTSDVDWPAEGGAGSI